MEFKVILKKSYRKFIRKLPMELGMRIDYLRGYRKILNLKDPKTYGEKINWIKLNGNLERYSNLVDKYAVREYINYKIGDVYLPKLYCVHKDVEELDFETLPKSFALKCNHGCKYNIICKDKSTLDIKKTKDKLQKWLNEDYFKEAKEIQYKGIDRKIICEEYLEDNNNQLIDYKYFCFKGEPKFMQVVSDRGVNISADFFDLDWNLLNLKNKFKNSSNKVKKPINLEKMNELARVLSSDFEFVRVDFYNIDGRIIFGELTFTPSAGVSRFIPKEKDYEIAKLINLNNYIEG